MRPVAEKAVSRPTSWQAVVVVCRKCGKKLSGGFGRKHKESLKTLLRQTLRDCGWRRDVRICETSCLGICPKGGVTALNATRPGTIHVIPAGSDGAEAMRILFGDHTCFDSRGVDIGRAEGGGSVETA
jgi:predicted metal-binding protein